MNIPDYDDADFQDFLKKLENKKERAKAAAEMSQELMAIMDNKESRQKFFDYLKKAVQDVPQRNVMKSVLKNRHYLTVYAAMIGDEIKKVTGKDINEAQELAGMILEMGVAMITLGIYDTLHIDDSEPDGDVPDAFKGIIDKLDL